METEEISKYIDEQIDLIPTQDNSKEENIYINFKKYIESIQGKYSLEKEFVLMARWLEKYEEYELQPLVRYVIKSPSYKTMSIEQLRFYCYWRMNVRKDIFIEADRGYVILYSYELLNNIGLHHAKDTYDKLLKLLQHYGKKYDIGILISQWIHDYSILNLPSHMFIKTIKDILKYYNEGAINKRLRFFELLRLEQYELLIECLDDFSDYKALKGKLCKDIKQKKLYCEVVVEVIKQMSKSLKNQNNNCLVTAFMDTSSLGEWKLFNGALVELSNIEKEDPYYEAPYHICYIYKNDKWMTSNPVLTNNINRYYIANILKDIEMCICERLHIDRSLRYEGISDEVQVIIESVVWDQTKTYLKNNLTALKAEEVSTKNYPRVSTKEYTKDSREQELRCIGDRIAEEFKKRHSKGISLYKFKAFISTEAYKYISADEVDQIINYLISSKKIIIMTKQLVLHTQHYYLGTYAEEKIMEYVEQVKRNTEFIVLEEIQGVKTSTPLMKSSYDNYLVMSVLLRNNYKCIKSLYEERLPIMVEERKKDINTVVDLIYILLKAKYYNQVNEEKAYDYLCSIGLLEEIAEGEKKKLPRAIRDYVKIYVDEDKKVILY